MVLSAFGPAPSGVFFTGSATAPSTLVPAQFPVAIGGHAYPIEPKFYSRSFLPLQRDARMDETEPGEVAVSPSGMWRRSQSDWSLGAGQQWLDEIESTRRRFDTSLGVDVFRTDDLERRACLLPDTEQKASAAGTNLRLLRVGTRIYAVTGNAVGFSDGAGGEQAASWLGFTFVTGLPGGTVLDIAFSGSHVYILGSDNSIYRSTIGTTAQTLYYNPAAVATRIWTGLGRLFMSDGRSLYEVTATPGETLIFTHPDPNYVISHVCAAPTGIYITGNIGSQLGEIRHSWIKDDGTSWVPPVVAAEFINEAVNTCISAGKALLIGTERGWRFSEIDGATTGLDFGPVVAVGTVRQFVLDNDGDEIFAWFTWDNINGAGVSGLGRIRLARFTEPRVPAYASDIYRTTGGGSVLTVTSLSGRRYFAISTVGFYGATVNHVAEGTLRTGRIRYSLLDEKVFSTIHIRTDPLEGGRVIVTVHFDDGASTVAGALDTVGAVQLGALNLGPRRGEWAEIEFTFERDGVDPMLGPCLRWWHLRALPAPDATQRFLIPLRLFEKEQTPKGPIRALDVLNEIDFLATLVKNQSVVVYQEGHSSYTVHLANIEVGGGSTGQWNDPDSRMEGITMVEALTMD